MYQLMRCAVVSLGLSWSSAGASVFLSCGSSRLMMRAQALLVPHQHYALLWRLEEVPLPQNKIKIHLNLMFSRWGNNIHPSIILEELCALTVLQGFS